MNSIGKIRGWHCWTSTYEVEIDQLLKKSKSNWDIKDLGTSNLCLGANKQFMLHQENHIIRTAENWE
jgi:hypothetical protein